MASAALQRRAGSRTLFPELFGTVFPELFGTLFSELSGILFPELSGILFPELFLLPWHWKLGKLLIPCSLL